jgi:hypothetical protein
MRVFLCTIMEVKFHYEIASLVLPCARGRVLCGTAQVKFYALAAAPRFGRAEGTGRQPKRRAAKTVLKEEVMNHTAKSLRLLVEKWLAPTPAMPVRVTRFGRTRFSQSRYVRVESQRPEGSIAIFFFRHGDGTWCVFPPQTTRLTMQAYLGPGNGVFATD